MKHIAKPLLAFLSGPPPISQLEFAERCGLEKSKLNRIINGGSPCDREALDAILAQVPTPEARRAIISAYLQDCASPFALSHLSANRADPWSGLDFSRLSPAGAEALRFLLSHDGAADIERMFITMAAAMRPARLPRPRRERHASPKRREPSLG